MREREPEWKPRGLRTAIAMAAILAAVDPGSLRAQPAWAPNTFYAVDEVVTHNGTVYEAIQAHTAYPGWEPPNVPALWRIPAPPPGAVSTWAPQVFYPLGSRVTFDGFEYEVRQAHTSQSDWPPPETPALWAMPATPGELGLWIPQKMYLAGDVVTHLGVLYRALSEHVSEESAPPPAAPGVWALEPAADCAGAADGTLCQRPWYLPLLPSGLPGGAPGTCQQNVCVRSDVSEAMYLWPWVSQPEHLRSVGDAAELAAVLVEADADPEALFTVFLVPDFGEIPVEETLRLRRGKVWILGDVGGQADRITLLPALDLATPEPDDRKEIRLFHVAPDEALPDPDHKPVLALTGITLTGVELSSGAGPAIFSKDAALFLRGCIIRDNKSQSSSGIVASGGFLYVDKSHIHGNQNNDAAGILEAIRMDEETQNQDACLVFGLRKSSCGVGQFERTGGIELSAVGEAYILSSTVSDNAACQMAGINSLNSNLYMGQNTVARNGAAQAGGGVHATGPGYLGLYFNTIAENIVGIDWFPERPPYGGGVGLRSFSGKLSMVGNIIADNVTRHDRDNGQPYVGIAPCLDPQPDEFNLHPVSGQTFTTDRGWFNNIKLWTLPQPPSALGIGGELTGNVSGRPGPLDPLLGAFEFHGRWAEGLEHYIRLPTYLVPPQSEVSRVYFPDPSDPDNTREPLRDQRGFLRNGPFGITVGATDPDGEDPDPGVD